MRIRAQRRLTSAALTAVVLTGCSTAGGGSAGSGSHVLNVAASINAWGSVLAQLGGSHVHATSIITSPDTDPHDYEPTPADGRVLAETQLFVENGIGYDAWADKALAANPVPGRTVINVGKVVGVPDNGNPHRWYAPTDVATVASAITAALKKLDPTDASYYDQQHATFLTSALGNYHRLIDDIKSRYRGVPVGASESIFSPMADALGLDLVTPASFLRAISEGTDPSPADKATIDGQIARGSIKVYVFNSQNSTPDVSAQVRAAKARQIPVVAVTETLSPASASFQQWQAGQLAALQAALHEGTGR